MALLDIWHLLDKSLVEVELIKNVIETGIVNGGARSEGYIYLADEVITFVSVTKNIGSEIETQTSRLNETLSSPTHTRVHSLSENILIENQTLLKSSTEGDLHRPGREFKHNFEVMFRVHEPNNQLALNSQENTPQTATIHREKNVNHETRHFHMDKSTLIKIDDELLLQGFKKKLEDYQTTVETRFSNLFRRTEAEEIRLETLESHLVLATSKLKSVLMFKEFAFHLNTSREELNDAKQEY